LAYTGFLSSLWPYIIPPSVTIWQAAAHENSQLFALIGALILIPIIVIYTGMSYWVFRHKVRVGDDGYHLGVVMKGKQTLWFVGLWLAGFLTLALIAGAFRFLVHLAYLISKTKEMKIFI